MPKIDTSSWGEFELRKLFGDCKKGSRLVQAERIDGYVPLVTAGYENVGITTNIGNTNMEVFKDCITIDMFGNCFYRDYKFNADDNVLIFAENIKNKYVSMYIAGVVGKAASGYDYTNQYRINNYNRQEIKLPIDSNGNPDWQYMEDYMRDVEVRVSDSISKLESARDVENNKIDISGWGEFKVGDLFDAERGKVKKLQTLENGDTPVIAAARTNQGVAGYYSVPTLYENKITVSCNGVGCGSTFYHPYSFNVNGDAIVLREINPMSGKVKQFMSCVLDGALTRKYSYEEKCSADKAKAEIIKLPIDSNGNPDWQYMEDYMRNIENKVEQSLSGLMYIAN